MPGSCHSTSPSFGERTSGSHVVQQLAHQGLGTIIAVDNETLDETNLGRVVGATHVDIDRTRKVNLAERVATAIDPDINVGKVDKRFPSPEAIVALKTADVIVSCVDLPRARSDQPLLPPLHDPVGFENSVREVNEAMAG